MPSPIKWGDEATVRERLRVGISDLRFTGLIKEPGTPLYNVTPFFVPLVGISRVFLGVH
jgi:hypothetical protein